MQSSKNTKEQNKKVQQDRKKNEGGGGGNETTDNSSMKKEAEDEDEPPKWMKANDGFWKDGFKHIRDDPTKLCGLETDLRKTVDDMLRQYKVGELAKRRPIFASMVVKNVAHVNLLGCLSESSGGSPDKNRSTGVFTNKTGCEVRIFPAAACIMTKGKPTPSRHEQVAFLHIRDDDDDDKDWRHIHPIETVEPVWIPPNKTFKLTLSQSPDVMRGAAMVMFTSTVQNNLETSSAWRLPDDFFRRFEGSEGSKDFLQPYVNTLVEFYSKCFKCSVAEIEARVHGLGDLAEDGNRKSVSFTVTTGSDIQLTNTYARTEAEVMEGFKPFATMEKDTTWYGRDSKPFLCGTLVPINLGDAVRVSLLPNVIKAIIVVLRRLTKEEIALQEAEKERAEFERNKRIAEDDAKWLKIEDFFQLNKHAPIRSEDIYQFLERNGVSNKAQKGTVVRLFADDESNGLKRTSVYAPCPYASDVWCVYAEKEDGQEAEAGAIVAGINPHYSKVKCPIYAGAPRAGQDTHHIPSWEKRAIHLEDSVKRAILIRVPQLQVDHHNSPASLHWKNILQERSMSTDGVGDASRKERTCAGCGIIWRQAMSRCAECRSVRYCSKACQRGDWRNHKKSCQPVASKK